MLFFFKHFRRSAERGSNTGPAAGPGPEHPHDTPGELSGNGSPSLPLEEGSILA